MNSLIYSYLKTGLFYLIYSFIFSIILKQSVYSFLTIFTTFTIIYYVLHYRIDSKTDSNNYSGPIKDYFDNLKQKYSLDNTVLRNTEKTIGEVLYKRNTNIICIPNEIKNKEEEKSLAAHELGHVYYNHRDKYIIGKFINIVLSILLLSVAININKISIIFISVGFVLFGTPVILNYIQHRFEYQADKFAVKNSSTESLSRRLRRNNTNMNSILLNYIPYLSSHPKLEKRIRKIHDF